MTLDVHLLHPPGDEALAHLRALLDPGVALTLGPDLPVSPRYQIFVAGRPTREHLSASPALHTLVIPFAGMPDVTRDLLRDGFSHLAVHNSHYNALPVAEMALALLLAAAKCIVPMDRALRAHDWRPRYQRQPSVFLAGKRALILGYGAVGQHVARLCEGLGMQVMATRRHVDAADHYPHKIYPPQALPDLLPQADALMICLPLTAETEGLIGAQELALLPPRAILVNIGRGPIVDEAVLYHALREGVLHAVGLDVWYHYPADETARAHTPPANFPFHELDNVVMSPHRSSAHPEREIQSMTHLAQLLNAAARGQEMPNRVDLELGY